MPVSISLQKNTPLFSRHFSSLKDPWKTSKGHFCYPLVEILFLVISAVISGMDSWVDITPDSVKKAKHRSRKKIDAKPKHSILEALLVDVLD